MLKDEEGDEMVESQHIVEQPKGVKGMRENNNKEIGQKSTIAMEFILQRV